MESAAVVKELMLLSRSVMAEVRESKYLQCISNCCH